MDRGMGGGDAWDAMDDHLAAEVMEEGKEQGGRPPDQSGDTDEARKPPSQASPSPSDPNADEGHGAEEGEDICDPVHCMICGEVCDAMDTPPCDCAEKFAIQPGCVIKCAVARNELDFGLDDDSFLASGESYESLSLKLIKPWLNCSKCGAEYRGEVKLTLAKGFYNAYMDRGAGDFKRLVAILTMVSCEINWLESCNNLSARPYQMMQRLKTEFTEHFRSSKTASKAIHQRHCSKKKNRGKMPSRSVIDSSQRAKFESDMEKKIAAGLAHAEFYQPYKVVPKPTDACCWICLDEEGGELLSTGCACRSIYVHPDCLRSYAVEKNSAKTSLLAAGEDISNIPLDSNPEYRNILVGQDIQRQYQEPWQRCPTCRQSYQGRICTELADLFLQQYGSLPCFDLRKKAAYAMAVGICLDTKDHDKGINICDHHLNEIRALGGRPTGNGRYTSNDKMLTLSLASDESYIFIALRLLFEAKGDKAGADKCLKHLLYMGVEDLMVPRRGNTDGRVSVRELLDKGPGGIPTSISKGLNAETKRSLHGPESAEYLHCIFMKCLFSFKDEKVSRKKILGELTSIVVDMRRILGDDHVKTQECMKYYETTMGALGFDINDPMKTQVLEAITVATLLSDNPTLDGRNVQVLRYTKNNEKLIVTFEHAGKEQKVKVPPNKLIFGEGVNVVLPNGKSGMICGYDGESKTYNILCYGDKRTVKYRCDEITMRFGKLNIDELKK